MASSASCCKLPCSSIGKNGLAGISPQESGQLRRSITTRVSDNEVEIGTNDPKAPTQHFGAKQGQVYIIKYGKLCLML
jgi:phage gpG-like protein